MSELRRLVVTFGPDSIVYAVLYSHTDEPPTPGSKTRTTRAARMARKALEMALEGLDIGPVLWGGFGTNTKTSRDTIMVDREERVA